MFMRFRFLWDACVWWEFNPPLPLSSVGLQLMNKWGTTVPGKAMAIKTRNVLFKNSIQHLQNNLGLLKDFGVLVGWENQGGAKYYPCAKVIPELTQSRLCLTSQTDTTWFADPWRSSLYSLCRLAAQKYGASVSVHSRMQSQGSSVLVILNFYQEDELGSDGRDHRPIAQFQENMNLLLMFSLVKVRD